MSPPVLNGRRRSSVWNYCTKIDERRAWCKLCQSVLRMGRGSTTNLIRHFRYRHPEVLLKLGTRENVPVTQVKEPKLKQEGEQITTTKRSYLWNHFTQVSLTCARCEVCNLGVSVKGGSTANLARHLAKRHSDIEIDCSTTGKREMTFDLVDSGLSSDPLADPNPTRCRSIVWKHFTKTSLVTAQCHECSRNFSYVNGTTANLLKHLKLKHPDVQLQTEELDNQNEEEVAVNTEEVVHIKVESFPSENSSNTADISENQNVDEQLVKTIISNKWCFTMVSDRNVLELFRLLNYCVPNTRTICDTTLLTMYSKTLFNIKNKINSAPAVTVTMNVSEWAISVSVHCITSDCKLNSYWLGSIKSETAEEIADDLKQILNKWSLFDRVIALVTNNLELLTPVAQALSWDIIPCCEYILDKIVRTGLSKVELNLNKVLLIVKYLSRNHDNIDPDKLKHFDVRKRELSNHWIDTYNILTVFLELRDSLISTMLLLNPDLVEFNDLDWNIVEYTHRSLALFHSVYQELSELRTVTVSKVTLLSKALSRHCAKLREEKGLPDQVVDMLDTFIIECELQFAEVQTKALLTEAALLDPRFKNHGLTGQKQNENAQNLLLQLVNEIEVYDEFSLVATSTTSVASTSSLWEEFDAEQERDENPNSVGLAEVKKYLHEPPLKRGIDPLTWWSSQKKAFPRLFELMKQRLCVSVSSVLPNGDMSLTDCQYGLNSDSLSQVLFLRYNMNE